MSTTRGISGRNRAHGAASGIVEAQLAAFFHRNGYIRQQNVRRAESEGWDQYKKGDEFRLVANDAEELIVIRRLLREAGFRPGQPFVHGRQHRQPVYGREAVKRFLDLVGESPTAGRHGATN